MLRPASRGNRRSPYSTGGVRPPSIWRLIILLAVVIGGIVWLLNQAAR
jgi:hypothetical protein